MKKLEGKKIAVLVTDGFEQSELTEPVKAIKSEGGQVDIIAPDRNKVKSWNNGTWGLEFEVDKSWRRQTRMTMTACCYQAG